MTAADLAELRARLAALPAAEATRAHAALADGTYGLCATCGDEIAPDALRARPTLARCDACAAEKRRSNEGRRFGICGVRPTT